MIKNYFFVRSILYIVYFPCDDVWNINAGKGKIQQKIAKVSNIKTKFRYFGQKTKLVDRNRDKQNVKYFHEFRGSYIC